MNTRRISIRLAAPLPIHFFGGKTHWRIFLAHGGKNGKEGALIAYCLTDKRQINIIAGRSRYIDGAAYRDLVAPSDTLLGRIFCRLLRLGLAVPSDGTDPYQRIRRMSPLDH